MPSPNVGTQRSPALHLVQRLSADAADHEAASVPAAGRMDRNTVIGDTLGSIFWLGFLCTLKESLGRADPEENANHGTERKVQNSGVE